MSMNVNSRSQSFDSLLPNETSVSSKKDVKSEWSAWAKDKGVDAKVATVAKPAALAKPSKPLSSYACVKFARDTLLAAPRVVVSLLTAISSLATLVLGGIANKLLPEKYRFSVIDTAKLQARTAAIGFALAIVKPINDIWIGLRELVGKRTTERRNSDSSRELAQTSTLWLTSGTTRLRAATKIEMPKALAKINRLAAKSMGAGSMIKVAQRTDLESNQNRRSAAPAA